MFKQKIFSRVLLTNWLRRPVKLSLGVGLFFILVGGLFFNLASPVVAEAGISNATKGSLDLMKATAKEANLHNDSSVYNISKEGDKGEIVKMITKLVKIVFGLVGVISFLVIMLAGLLWMTAVGNDNQVAKSKKMIADAVLGVVIVSLAYAIINTVLFIIMKIGG